MQAMASPSSDLPESDDDALAESVCINRRPPRVSGNWLIAILVLGVVLGAFGSWGSKAPPPAAGFQFDADRAWQHLQALCGQGVPHPTGSPAHAEVREYLVRQFEELGYRVQVQTTEPVEVWGEWHPLNNLIAARPEVDLEGPAERDKLLFVAHYDSTPMGPGAGDDGAAVAALLELARLEMESSIGRRDTVFLITDGEEAGLKGARAWVDHCDWLDSVELVFNFEARGSGGASFLFETSPGNQNLIHDFAGIAPHPKANSLAYEVYRWMPNATDFTILKDRGLNGLNFAFVGDVRFYHQPEDTPENLDRNSLIQHGQTAESLWRFFRDVEEVKIPSGQANAVYFDVASRTLLWWPQVWNWPWWMLSAGLYVACFFCCSIGSLRDIVFGAFGWAILMVTMIVLVGIAVMGFQQQLWFEPFWGRYVWGLGVAGALVAFWCIATIGWGLAGGLIECITKDKSLWIAVWGSWLLLTAGVLYLFPGGSFLFLIPVTAACCFRLLGSWPPVAKTFSFAVSTATDDGSPSGWQAENPLFMTWLPCLVTWFLWLPIQYALLTSLGYRYGMLYVVLVPWLLSPTIPLAAVVTYRSKMVLMAMGLVLFAILVAGLFATAPH